MAILSETFLRAGPSRPRLSISCKGEAMSDAVNWRGDWEAALKEAKEAKRPLVLEIYMEG